MTPHNSANPEKQEKLYTPGEVANRFRVDPKTVTRWAKAGLLPCIKTPGGHRRYRASMVDALAIERTEQATVAGPAENQ